MTTTSTFSEYALYILDTVKASCSIAEIMDRLTYLDDRRRNDGK